MADAEEQECILKVCNIIDYRIRAEGGITGKQPSERVVSMRFCDV
ncbi:MAG: hypothetical protein AB9861_05420 [Methanosarcina sp.]|jgi:hypothetical protein